MTGTFGLREEGRDFVSYMREFGTWVIGGVGSVYAFVSGHVDVATQILLAMMMLDIATGIMRGIQAQRLKSAIMSLGIMKKGAILLSVVFAYLLDILLNGGKPIFATMMTWVAIGNEGLSVAENFTALGVTIPQTLKDKLAKEVSSVRGLQDEKDHKQ